MKMCRTSGRPRTTSPVKLIIMLAVLITTVSTSGLNRIKHFKAQFAFASIQKLNSLCVFRS
jgi:hypothetical protein